MSSHLRVLRQRDFRFLFLGQSASAVGDQAVIVALVLYITRRTGSATDIGVVLAAQSLPMVALLLFGGVWADRLPRHRIMIATDVIRAALHTVLAALIFAGAATVGAMVVIEMLFGAARAFFQPAYTGLLPQTIPAELAQEARALSETTANLATVVGPALGTALVLGVGAGEAFAFDAATFVLSALLLARVRPRMRSAGPPVARAAVLHELRAGWREVRSRPWVWATIGAFSGALLCCYAQYYALGPIIARTVYGGVGVFGVLETVMGVGAVLGALIGIRWRPRRPLVAGLLLIIAWPVYGLVFSLGSPLVVVFALELATGFAFSLFIVWWETALARNIPATALSRVSSYDWMGSTALLPVGFAVAGPLAATFGAQTVLGVGSALALVMLALALIPRSTRELTGSAEQFADDVEVEAGGEAQVTDVDPLVRVMHERRGL
jgi:MFS family permease